MRSEDIHGQPQSVSYGFSGREGSNAFPRKSGGAEVESRHPGPEQEAAPLEITHAEKFYWVKQMAIPHAHGHRPGERRNFTWNCRVV